MIAVAAFNQRFCWGSAPRSGGPTWPRTRVMPTCASDNDTGAH